MEAGQYFGPSQPRRPTGDSPGIPDGQSAPESSCTYGFNTRTRSLLKTFHFPLAGTVTAVCLECCGMNILKNVWVHRI